VSITQRILESAQSQWSKLTSLVIVDEEPLSHIEGPALQAELAARKAARAAAKPAAPSENPIARIAGSGDVARQARDRAAAARRIRVTKERDERAAKQKAAADDAFRRMKDEARTGGSGTSGRSGQSSYSGSGGRPPRPGSSEAQLLEWYKTLDVPVGADLAQIKSSYRQLMRKYHPDMHAGNPQKEKAATELSLRVTTAYNGLVEHLEKNK
jgi:DnaJ-domain-containing protein 1